MIICVNNTAKKVDFVKQSIFGGADVPKGDIAGIINFGIAPHICAEIVETFPCDILAVIGRLTVCLELIY